MLSRLSFLPLPTKLTKRLADVGVAALSLALLGQPAVAADSNPSSRVRPKGVEVQDHGSIDDAITKLTAGLGLSETQALRMKAAMVHRAESIAAGFAAAEKALRARLESLLTPAQQKRIAGAEDQRWTDISRWNAELGDLTAEQTAELTRLIKQRNDAIRTTLREAGKTYGDAVSAVLTAEQKKRLDDLQAADTVEHIPMNH